MRFAVTPLVADPALLTTPEDATPALRAEVRGPGDFRRGADSCPSYARLGFAPRATSSFQGVESLGPLRVC